MKKAGPVCSCPHCYAEWAKEEIARLEYELEQMTKERDELLERP